MVCVRVRVEQTPLPGIGVRHDLITSSGRTVGVVSHRNGRRDLLLYDVDDPDACLASIPLTDDEAEALADVLGASLMLGQLAGLRQQAAGLLTEQIALPAGSPFVGRRLGDVSLDALSAMLAPDGTFLALYRQDGPVARAVAVFTG